MEDKPLTESINKQYSKYGSLRSKEKESKIELCNAEDPMKFLTRIDSSIKDAKARVKKSIDNSSISEDYESSFDQLQTTSDTNQYCLGNNIPLVKLDRTKAPASDTNHQPNHIEQTSTSTAATSNSTDVILPMLQLAGNRNDTQPPSTQQQQQQYHHLTEPPDRMNGQGMS